MTRPAREVCFLIGRRRRDPVGRRVRQPGRRCRDSRARWEAIWELRDELEEIAHWHPVGPSAFSAEDESTMAALDSALGQAVRYSSSRRAS